LGGGERKSYWRWEGERPFETRIITDSDPKGGGVKEKTSEGEILQGNREGTNIRRAGGRLSLSLGSAFKEWTIAFFVEDGGKKEKEESLEKKKKSRGHEKELAYYG